VVLENVRAPENVRLKQRFHLEAVISSNRSTPALIQVYRNGTLLQEGTIALEQKRKEVIRLPQTVRTPGVYRYEVKLKPQHDFQSENNSLSAWIFVEGPPQILLVDENPEELRHLQIALRERGFEVNLKPDAYFPDTLEEMLVYQAIIVRNVPARSIHNAMPKLKQYVHDFGGGFAMLGGEKSFGPGGYFQTPVEEILPVRMELINKKYLADVAMVIVIDKSGSMSLADRGRQKIDLADEGAARVASLLKKSDRLGVLAVDSVAKWAYPLQKLDKVDEAIAAITSIRAGGGGIYVYSGLLKAYETLQQTKASVKHVILFGDTADCEEKEGPQGDSSLLLAQQMLREHKITTTTIGIGQIGDIDVEFLRSVATLGEGRFYFTNDMFTLPEIFTQESAIAQRYYITEERFQPRLTDSDSILTTVEGMPDLFGYVATSRKETATAAIVSHREDPILAFWRHGFGNALAFTSDPTEKWGRLWLAWPEFQRFWSQVGRYLARDLPSPNFKVSISRSGEKSIIVVDALDAGGKFFELADFRGVITDGSERHVLQFHQTAPGRYEAAVSAAGGLFGKIYRMQEETIQEESVVQFPAERTREFTLDAAQGRDYLLHLAERIVTDPAQLIFPAKQSQQVHPIGNALLLWAAFLFIVDV
ncbi:MAG TPA: VWA domain-containing protein, partial [Acidobacteriota bacterium]|nr:VWA domain-containing protein [Acidobacteriota bacterium]